MKNKLEEKMVARGLTKFVESFTMHINPRDIEIFETPKLIESIDGGTFKARGVIKNVDISRYIENLNDRIYGRTLWENVKTKKMGEGSYCLVGHPQDEGNPQNICGVWHGLEVGEKTPTSNLYMIGDNGDLMKEAIEAGALVGFSTVGFGKLLEDGKTVDPETYELQRMGDWVLEPSQGVFATKENMKEESVKNTQIESKIVETTNNKIEDKKTEVNMSNIHESNLKNQVRIAIKEATVSNSYKEAITDLEELQNIVPSELSETHGKLDDAISSIQEKMDKEIQEKKIELEEKAKILVETQSELETANSSLADMKERYERIQSIVEKLGLEESEKLEENVVAMKEDLDTAKDNIEKMQVDIEAYEEDTDYRQYDLDRQTEDLTAAREEVEALKESIEAIEAEKVLALDHIKELEVAIMGEGYEVDSFDEKAKAKKEEEDPKDEPKDDKDDKDPKDDKDDKDDKKDEEPLKEEDPKEDKEKDPKDEKDEKDPKDEKDEKDPKDEKDDKKKDEKMKEDVILGTFKPEVVAFFNEAVKEKESLKDIKKEILSAGSILEAVKLVDSFTKVQTEEVVVKIEESDKTVAFAIKPSWLDKRK